MRRVSLLNVANALTLSRFAAAPVLLGMILALARPELAGPPSALAAGVAVLFGLALLTDLFDGLVARRYGIVTDFGKIMDPVADSTLFMTVLFAFADSPRFREALPVWIPLVVLYREVAMQVLRRYAALRGEVVAAKWSGKAKMAAQSVVMLAFLSALAASDLGWWGWSEAALGRFLFWAGVFAAAVNVLSFAEYLRDVPRLIEEKH